MKRLALLTGVAVFSLTLLTPIVVLAHGNAHAQSSDITKAIENARNSAEEKRKSKDARVAEIKQQVEARKLAVKQDACERSEAKLNARVKTVNRNAATIKAVIDKKYERVQEFYASGKLTTPDYDALIAGIELAKANADSSLEALRSYTVDVDCTSEKAGGQLDSFRSAASQAKEDLKTYRKELVALISALQSANSNKNKSTEDGGDTGDDSSNDNEDEQENEGGETTE